MQGPGLLLLAPLIACFFLGGAWLSVALSRIGVVSRGSAHLHAVAVGVAVVGGALASTGMVPACAVGLAALGAVSGAQIWVGVALWTRGAKPAAA